MDYEEYKKFYFENGRCIDQLQTPKNKMNDNQIRRRFDKYKKRNNISSYKTKKESLVKNNTKFSNEDELWVLVREIAYLRDSNECQFLKIIGEKEKESFYKIGGYGLAKKLDPCHIFGKGSYPEDELSYNPENIVICNRVFHSLIDNNKNPITGKSLEEGEKEKIWIRIIGKKRYEELVNISEDIKNRRRM